MCCFLLLLLLVELRLDICCLLPLFLIGELVDIDRKGYWAGKGAWPRGS